MNNGIQILLADEGNPEPIKIGTRLILVYPDNSKSPAVVHMLKRSKTGHLWGYLGISGNNGHQWFQLSATPVDESISGHYLKERRQ
jgi:hypothetical protein